MGGAENSAVAGYDSRRVDAKMTWPWVSKSTMAKVLVPCLLVAALVAACSSSPAAASDSVGGSADRSRVLLGGTFEGHKGRCSTIQSAVNAARPGDWVLVGPGD